MFKTGFKLVSNWFQTGLNWFKTVALAMLGFTVLNSFLKLSTAGNSMLQSETIKVKWKKTKTIWTRHGLEIWIAVLRINVNHIVNYNAKNI